MGSVPSPGHMADGGSPALALARAAPAVGLAAVRLLKI
jgi:hypothetical protein